MFDPREYFTIITKRYSIDSDLHGRSLYSCQTDTRCEITKKIVIEVPFERSVFNGNPSPLLSRMIS